jgi:hypothetical protein
MAFAGGGVVILLLGLITEEGLRPNSRIVSGATWLDRFLNNSILARLWKRDTLTQRLILYGCTFFWAAGAVRVYSGWTWEFLLFNMVAGVLTGQVFWIYSLRKRYSVDFPLRMIVCVVGASWLTGGILFLPKVFSPEQVVPLGLILLGSGCLAILDRNNIDWQELILRQKGNVTVLVLTAVPVLLVWEYMLVEDPRVFYLGVVSLGFAAGDVIRSSIMWDKPKFPTWWKYLLRVGLILVVYVLAVSIGVVSGGGVVGGWVGLFLFLGVYGGAAAGPPCRRDASQVSSDPPTPESWMT